MKVTRVLITKKDYEKIEKLITECLREKFSLHERISNKMAARRNTKKL
jgi:hypothetical protein